MIPFAESSDFEFLTLYRIKIDQDSLSSESKGFIKPVLINLWARPSYNLNSSLHFYV